MLTYCGSNQISLQNLIINPKYKINQVIRVVIMYLPHNNIVSQHFSPHLSNKNYYKPNL